MPGIAVQAPAQASRLKVARKQADQTLNQNSTALQDVADLLLTVAAGDVYEFEMTLYLNAASNTSDWQFDWAGSAIVGGAVVRYGSSGGPGGGAPGFGGQNTGTVPGSSLGISGVPTQYAGLNADHGITLKGKITAVIAGIVQFQAAQNLAEASNNKILAGSNLIATKI